MLISSSDFNAHQPPRECSCYAPWPRRRYLDCSKLLPIGVSSHVGATCPYMLELTFMSAQDIALSAHAGSWCIVTLLVFAVEGILAAELIQDLTTMLFGLV